MPRKAKCHFHVLSFSPNSQNIGQLFAESPVVHIIQPVVFPYCYSDCNYSTAYSVFSRLFATWFSSRLHRYYMICIHMLSFNIYFLFIFLSMIPFQMPLRKTLRSFPLSHSFHTASIDNIFPFFPISYFQMTKTQLRISRRNLIE